MRINWNWEVVTKRSPEVPTAERCVVSIFSTSSHDTSFRRELFMITTRAVSVGLEALIAGVHVASCTFEVQQMVWAQIS